MKKISTWCLFVLLQFNMSTVTAGVVGIAGVWDFDGYMNMYDPFMETYVGSAAFQGQLDFNGGGSYINHIDTFFSNPWSMHDISITDNGNGTYSAQMLFDFGTLLNTPVELLWDIFYDIDEVNAGMGRILVTSLDGDNDGVIAFSIEVSSNPIYDLHGHYGLAHDCTLTIDGSEHDKDYRSKSIFSWAYSDGTIRFDDLKLGGKTKSKNSIDYFNFIFKNNRNIFAFLQELMQVS